MKRLDLKNSAQKNKPLQEASYGFNRFQSWDVSAAP